MIDISAGHSHLLMTDGERCFAMGSWLDGASDTKTRVEWGIPREQMRAPVAGISQVCSCRLHRPRRNLTSFCRFLCPRIRQGKLTTCSAPARN